MSSLMDDIIRSGIDVDALQETQKREQMEQSSLDHVVSIDPKEIGPDMDAKVQLLRIRLEEMRKAEDKPAERNTKSDKKRRKRNNNRGKTKINLGGRHAPRHPGRRDF